ncbi:MAG: hypothetical protein KTR31_23300 [Myxococcales bacterium]|nr:hypothetical protein [Myxococcales bacterium]
MTWFRVSGGAVFTTVVLLSLACVGQVAGDRAASGDCPEGEVCSEEAVQGLIFVGQAFFEDQEALALGPIALGSQFNLGFYDIGGGQLPEFAVDGGTNLHAEVEEGPMPDTHGSIGKSVDTWATLSGLQSGTSTVRVVDAGGLLLDRLDIEVVEIERVEMEIIARTPRDVLISDCDELIAVRIYGTDESGSEVRLFGQDLGLKADGRSLDREVGMWDCFEWAADAPSEQVEVEFNVGRITRSRSFDVVTLEDLDLDDCPVGGID